MKHDDVTFEPEMGEEGAHSSKDPQATIKKLKERLKVCETERKEYLDGWQRMKADLANFKKEEEKRATLIRDYATEGLVSELIRVLESFQLAFANKQAWEKVDTNWRQGVEYIHSQLRTTLEDHGLSIIEPQKGEKFNPQLHHAVATVPIPAPKDDDTVHEVVKQGYRLRGKVLKPADVKVTHYSPNK